MNRYNRDPRIAGQGNPCLECDNTYVVQREWHYFCSGKCRVKYWLREKYDSKRVRDLEDRIKVLENK